MPIDRSSMAYQLDALLASPLAITTAGLAALHQLRARVDAEEIPCLPAALTGGRHWTDAKIKAAVNSAGSGGFKAGHVGVIPIVGVISQWTERAIGGTSTENASIKLNELLNDPSVKSILLLVDSGGGDVSGVPELADQILAARSVKEVVAVASPMAASAAYWIAAAASRVVVQSSGQVGSIGVVSAHQDISGALDQAGVKMTLVTSSRYKAEFSPFGPLDPEALAELQSKVNHYHGLFVDAVARGRGVSASKVQNNWGQGRMLTPRAALSVGMIDAIGDFKTELLRMSSSGGTGYTAARYAPRITAGQNKGDSEEYTDEELMQLGREWFKGIVDEWEAEDLPGLQGLSACGGPGSGVPGPCPTKGGEGSAQLHEKADAQAKTWTQKAKEVPGKVMSAARAKIAEKFNKLEGRYGRKTAIAIMAAGILGTAVPLPGTGLLAAAPIIGGAELYRAYKGGHKAAHGAAPLGARLAGYRARAVEVENLGRSTGYWVPDAIAARLRVLELDQSK